MFRRGQLVLIAAGPGTAKSALTLSMAIQAQIPSLIFSADSDAYTQLSRAISILTGIPMTESESMALEDELPDDVMEALSQTPIRIDYDAAPSIDMIEEIMESYWELNGEYPSIVVVDNITNVENENADGDPFAGLETLMEYLHSMARKTGACVIGLHHVKGDYNDGDKPIPLSGVKGQIGRVPQMILTLHKKQDELDPEKTVLCISPVKNRGGKPDATGQTYAELHFVGNHMSISDMEHDRQVLLDQDAWERQMEEEMYGSSMG